MVRVVVVAVAAALVDLVALLWGGYPPRSVADILVVRFPLGLCFCFVVLDLGLAALRLSRFFLLVLQLSFSLLLSLPMILLV